MKKICFVTGSRAEYGFLKALMEEVRLDSGLKLQLIVTGAHLSARFGMTYREIEKDGFKIDRKIKIILNSDSLDSICKSMGHCLAGFGRAYQELNPDIVIIPGDRYEIFSAAAAALVSRKIIGHIHGGEVTLGAIDDSFRHSITKMSHLHFVAAGEYRKRVIQLGEHPDRVFNVGALGLDNIRRLPLLSKMELERELGLSFREHNVLVTFHPVTLEDNTFKEQFANLLSVLSKLKNTGIIFTKANADTGGRVINKMIDDYISINRDNSKAFNSLGQTNYLSVMKFSDCVIGNSSSGIIEAPSFKIGTVNIGDRQKGRIMANSVVNCEPAIHSIENAIKRVYSHDFQKILKKAINPYGDGNTAKRIKNILKEFDFKKSAILKKSFYDIKF